MTVCVATIAQDGAIFGAADRMLTRGETAAERPFTKIYHLETPVRASLMWAGDAAVFSEVLDGCVRDFTGKPEKYTTVKDCVDLYCNQFAGYMGERAERAILTRLGLTRRDLTTNKVTYDHARRLAQDIIDYYPPTHEPVTVIIAGHDSTGAHLWTVFDTIPSCHDVEGYAAIGLGARHAYSQLEFAGYSTKATPPEALVLAYMAKRRGEAAPGVGKATDMFSRQAGQDHWEIPEAWLKIFRDEFEKLAEAERIVLRTTVKSVFGIMQQMAIKQPEAPSPGEAPQSPPESAHGQSN